MSNTLLLQNCHGHHPVTASLFRCGSRQFIGVSFRSRIANPTNTERTRSLAYWNEICDTLLEYLDSVIFCLPRLGSGVRIASPAPVFLREIKHLANALRGVFCFPGLALESGEAGGKHEEANSSVPQRAIGDPPRPCRSALFRQSTTDSTPFVPPTSRGNATLRASISLVILLEIFPEINLGKLAAPCNSKLSLSPQREGPCALRGAGP